MNHQKMWQYLRLLIILVFVTTKGANAQTLKLHYQPENDVINSTTITDISGNNNNGILSNGAIISTFDNLKVIDLGANNGYVNMGNSFGTIVAGLNKFSVFCKIYIPSSTSITSNGNFVWTFANSNDIANDAKGCLFFSAKNSRYAISPDKWTNESGIQTGNALEKGAWKTVCYVEENGTGSLYIDGLMVVTGEIKLTPASLGNTTYNYLGRSCYSGDAYLKNVKYADFRVYDGALSAQTIEELSGIKRSSDKVTLLAEFNFESTADTKNKYNGSLINGAQLIDYAGKKVLALGSNNGYFNFGSSFGNIIGTLDSFSISTNLFIPQSTNTGGAGNFIWSFANSDNMASAANGNMFLTAISTRYAITKTAYNAESGVNANTTSPQGRWINLSYSQLNNQGYIYIDGKIYAQHSVSINPKHLGQTAYNYLGRSCYSGDAYLKDALYSKFSVYQGAVGDDEIAIISSELKQLNRYVDSLFVLSAAAELKIENSDAVRSKIPLPGTVGDYVTVTWSSSNTNVVANDGSVFRPANGKQAIKVMLTATLTYNDFSTTKEIEVTVLPYFTDAESVAIDLSKLSIEGNVNNARSQLKLAYTSSEGSMISWSSSAPGFINNVGRVLKLAKVGEGKKMVILTAKATKGSVSQTKDFTVYIAEDENKAAYLFTYFTGNSQSQEQIRFAISYDGYNYIPLNNGNPVINSSEIALKKAVRDPHILRGEDGKTFYMVVTDMKSNEGWSSNRGMVLLKSTDLVNWTHSAINFPTRWPNQWANVTRVWAPQTIFDPQAGKYMVYFSLLTNDGKVTYDKIFYCYANTDFTDFEGEPQFLFDRGSATIDGDIVFNEEDNLFHMFFKNEGQGGICKVTASSLTAQNGQANGSQWSAPSDNLEQTNEAVEGAGVFRLINTNNWVLMYDCYGAGHYQFCSSSNLESFKFVMNNYSMDARHGTTIPITKEEADRLVKAFPSSALNTLTIGARNNNIRHKGITINNIQKTITLPLHYGVELSNFDPGFYATPGTDISPVGMQNFSEGSITYNFTLNGSTSSYTVKPEIEVNPVLPDFHADPEVLYSEKTGLFYIYPTTDGYTGWGGYSFDVFSSPDLVSWTNEGTFLDLSTSQVSWASGNAWAPCIEEKKMADNSYRYYFYFSGNAGDRKKIGVAVSDQPTGPFVDSGSPMINSTPSGTGGQIIDGDVFTDPVSGKSYFYYGNGFMAVAELNNDMISIKESTTQIITPQGGSLSTYAYREGTYVFYRNGIYYFLWSVDDTGSANYHVAYGTSTSPTGPIQVANQPIVIIQNAANKIYGPAHNSILQIPGKDEWYIVYHRINENYLNNGPGYHREVCIDRMDFYNDGTIKPVIPTQRGIDPVNLKNSDTGFNQPVKKKPGGKIIKQEYYTIYGQHLATDQLSTYAGIYIMLNTYENGAVEVYKGMQVN